MPVIGDCNIMKYTHSEELFLAHTLAVAVHNAGVEAWPGDAEESDGEEEEEGEVQEGGEQSERPVGDGVADESTADHNPFAAFAFGA